MRFLAPLALVACTAASAEPTKPAPAPPAPAKPAPPPAPAAPPTELHSMKMDGPYKTAVEACRHARPCGFTDMTEKGALVKPPKKPDCGAIADPSTDIAHPDNPAQLSSKAPFGEVRLGSVNCSVPRGLRYEHAEYYAFVKRDDGWWRSEPLYRADYNEKYCAVSTVARWNHQPGRTFLGLAVTSQCPACNRQGDETEALEYMIRIEAGDPKGAPLVYPPLQVGEKLVVAHHDDIDADEKKECKAMKEHISLDEKWSGNDDLVLSGAATWYAPFTEDGLVNIGLNSSKKVPSSAGAYKFTR